MNLTIASFCNVRDNSPVTKTYEWLDLRDCLTRHHPREVKDGPLFSQVLYRPGAKRGNGGVEAVTAFVADIDGGAPIEELRGLWSGLAFAAYSTWSHGPACPKYRVVFPLAKPVPADEWPKTWARLRRVLTLDRSDKSCNDAARVYYAPSCSQDRLQDAFFEVGEGAFLNADSVADPAEATWSAQTLSTRLTSPYSPPWWWESVPQGERNHAAFRRSRWLLNAHEGSRDRDDAWEEIAAWNDVACVPPLDGSELRRTFESAAKGGDNPNYNAPSALENMGVGVREPKWPTPDEAMYHGLLGEIVRVIEPHTEADPVAILVQLIVMFGSAVGRTAHTKAEADSHYCNLYAVLVGTTSKGRKGTSAGRARQVMKGVDPLWCATRVVSGLSSGEGLIHNVRDPVQKLVLDKKTKEYVTEIVDEGVEDKRLLVHEAEFASVLRNTARDGNTLSAAVRNAWDTGELSTLTKNSPARATDAHISIIGHITTQELIRELSSTEAGNGFANRFLWVCVRRSKELPEGGSLRDADLAQLIARLSQCFKFAQIRGEMRRDEHARALWIAVYHDLSQGNPGLFGSVTSRSEAQVMRIATIYALLDCSILIGESHLLAALALWQYCEDSARFIFGDSLGDKVADEILAELRGRPAGMTRTDIRDFYKRNQTASRIDAALATLAKLNLAQCETSQTDGKPVTTWRAN